jgi:hypothetical protein
VLQSTLFTAGSPAGKHRGIAGRKAPFSAGTRRFAAHRSYGRCLPISAEISKTGVIV